MYSSMTGRISSLRLAIPKPGSADSQVIENHWRKRVRVEHTQDRANLPRAGFEDREDHRIPCASVLRLQTS